MNGIVFIFVCTRFLLSQGIHLTRETELHFGFDRGSSVSDARNHNRVLLGSIKASDEGFHLVKHLNPLLFTHIGLMFQITQNNSSAPFALKGYDGNNEAIVWLIELAKLKIKNPSLKLVVVIENSLTKVIEIASVQRRRNAYFVKVYNFLRRYNFDGIVLQEWDDENYTESIRSFLCGLREYLVEGAMEISFWMLGTQPKILKYDIAGLTQCVDYILIQPAVNDFRTSFLPHLYKTPNTSLPLDLSTEGAVALLLQLGLPREKLVLGFSINGLAYTLSRTQDTSTDKSKDYMECCGEGVSATVEADFPELNKRTKSIIPFELCSLSNSTWQIYRSHPGKEAFLTDGRRWITMKDNITMDENFRFVAKKNLAGVAILLILSNGQGDKNCKVEDYTNISLSYVHQANHFFYEHLKENRTVKNNQTVVQPKLLDSFKEERCKLVSELKSAGIPSEEHNSWVCVAYLESGFNRKFSKVGPPFQDAEGCSTAKFGIFGLQSPICSSPLRFGDTCGKHLCDAVCQDLAQENITNSINCLFNATRVTGGEFFPPSWPYCFDQSQRLGLGIGDCEFLEQQEQTQGMSATTVITVVGLALTLLILLAAAAIFIKVRRVPSTAINYEETDLFETENVRGASHSETQNVAFDCDSDELLEIGSEAFEIDKNSMIGTGEFGVVYKALVRKKPAAAKTLKPFADERHLIAMLEEIKVMTDLGKHDNVVEFIGAFTQKLDKGKVILFMEYCDFGSLKGYLKNGSKSLETQDNSEKICKRDLLLWSHQIANGMLHLASKNVLHGSLSARNILLNKHKVAKVSDFGFSRKLHNYTTCVKKGQAPPAWRWMSPEALKELKFSTKSDVWSFGVTLWEIFSLGTLPYPGFNYSLTFVEQLLDGSLRLPNPENADDVIYDSVFLPTWNVDPELRPGFDELESMLKKMVDAETDLAYTMVADNSSSNFV